MGDRRRRERDETREKKRCDTVLPVRDPVIGSAWVMIKGVPSQPAASIRLRVSQVSARRGASTYVCDLVGYRRVLLHVDRERTIRCALESLRAVANGVAVERVFNEEVAYIDTDRPSRQTGDVVRRKFGHCKAAASHRSDGDARRRVASLASGKDKRDRRQGSRGMEAVCPRHERAHRYGSRGLR